MRSVGGFERDVAGLFGFIAPCFLTRRSEFLVRRGLWRFGFLVGFAADLQAARLLADVLGFVFRRIEFRIRQRHHGVGVGEIFFDQGIELAHFGGVRFREVGGFAQVFLEVVETVTDRKLDFRDRAGRGLSRT